MVCLSNYTVDHVLLLCCANCMCASVHAGVCVCVCVIQLWPPFCSVQNQMMQALLMMLLPIQALPIVQDQTGV